MFKKIKQISLLGMLSTFCYQTFAISVDSLFQVADDRDSAILNVVNPDDITMFVKISSTKLEYTNGERQVINLTKDNVGHWGLQVSPIYLVLEPGEEKSVRLKYVCKSVFCSRDKDIVYGVDLSPKPYDQPEQQSLSMLLGYKTYFVVPSKNPMFDFDWKVGSEGKATLSNTGNTTLIGVIDTCSEGHYSGCVYKYRLLPGAEREINIPSSKTAKNIKFVDLTGNLIGEEEL